MFGRKIAGALAVFLAGCTTPQHTNLLIFGTNTVGGLKIGADVNQVPTIQLAYSRQELVLMPLLANTLAARPNGDLLMQPCPVERGTPPPTPSALALNCKFLGNDEANLDTYSVMASFGAKGGATAGRGTAEARGAVAQYFATGLAARELARHGAALVATSESATREAEISEINASPELRRAIEAQRQGVTAREAQRRTYREAVAAKIETSADYKARLTNVDTALGLTPPDGFAKGCSSAESASACATAIRSGALVSYLTADEWQQALAAVLK